jgi:hypothetical protein
MKIDKVYFYLAVIPIASTCLWISSCVHDLGIPPGTPEICFDSEVLPLFVNNCSMTGCHDGISGESNWKITTYDEVMRGITHGSPDQSYYYLYIIGKGGGLMPPDRPLPLESRAIIRLWILQGAAHTTCPVTPVKKSYPAGDEESVT